MKPRVETGWRCFSGCWLHSSLPSEYVAYFDLIDFHPKSRDGLRTLSHEEGQYILVVVPTGSSSRGGDVAVYVSDIN